MRVLIVPEYDTFGGTFSFLKRLLEIHKIHGIETAVLIEKRQLFPDAVELFEHYGVRTFVGPRRFGRFRNALFAPFFDAVFCWWSYRVFRPDLLVVSNGTPGLMTGALAYPAPVVFFMHTYPQHGKMRWMVRRYISAVSRLRNRFVAVSNFAAGKISDVMGIPPDRMAVIYNSFAPVTAGMEEKPSIVLTIGHVASFKNPDTWLNVAERVVTRCPDVRFVWLGGGEMLETMRAQVRELGLDSRIEFAGYSDDVRSYFRKTVVYFQPSLVESHGISVVEAMAHGIPCVTSDAGGLPESVANSETGIICPTGDVDGFAEGIVELLDNRDLRVKMGTAGQIRSEKLFSGMNQEAKILDLYAELLKDSARK